MLVINGIQAFFVAVLAYLAFSLAESHWYEPIFFLEVFGISFVLLVASDLVVDQSIKWFNKDHTEDNVFRGY